MFHPHRASSRVRESKEVQNIKRKIINGPRVRALLAGQKANGGFGVHPYRKWTGLTVDFFSCVELGVPNDNKVVRKAAETILVWLGKNNQQHNLSECSYHNQKILVDSSKSAEKVG